MTTFAEILDEDVPDLPEDGMHPHLLHFEVLYDVVLGCIFFCMKAIVVVIVISFHHGFFNYLSTVPSSKNDGTRVE
jgi:hypothetical protein